MSLKKKAISIISACTSVTAAISIMNKIIFESAINNYPHRDFISHTYHWKFGDISYTQSGSGHPVLLIHSIQSDFNSYEWHEVTDSLSESRTVYTIDLLGCGLSEKPDFTYTNFLFVQLINDFIKNVIGGRTDVITSGASSSIALMSCVYNENLMDKIILLSPNSLNDCNHIPSHYSKFCRLYYDLPIFGTFAYNIAFSKRCIREDLSKNFFDSKMVSPKLIDVLYHNAHLGKSKAKYLHSSMRAHYTNISISQALKTINNNIYILVGEESSDAKKLVQDYQALNPAIEDFTIPKSKSYLALESPNAVLDIINCL